MKQLEALASLFPPISLEEMSSVKLMNRIDTKFLITKELLPTLFQRLQGGYRICENRGVRVARYITQYYDTPDVQMFVAHQNGKLNRQKLRTRIYCTTNEAFCEIKNKNNKRRTKKKRIPIQTEQCAHVFDYEEIREFVGKKLRYSIADLVPQVGNEFKRITLVNNAQTERLTIDTDIHFSNARTGRRAEVQGLVIIELKQDGNTQSFFKQVLAEMRIRPYRVSKYCLGTMLTDPDVTINRFKKKLRYINKLLQKNVCL